MRTTFEQRLGDLEARLLQLGHSVRSQLVGALEVLATGSAPAAAEVAGTQLSVRQAAARINWDVLSTIALEQPVAGDLRLLAGVLHVDAHLERMGALCENLAKAGRRLAGLEPPSELRVLLDEMGAEALRVVDAALACLERCDLALAEELPGLDQAVDRLNEQVFELIDRSPEGGPGLGWAIQAVLIARFLERLGDQAVDIGEQVGFIVTGEVREFLPPKAARLSGPDEISSTAS